MVVRRFESANLLTSTSFLINDVVSIPEPDPKELIMDEPVPAVLGVVLVVDVIAMSTSRNNIANKLTAIVE